MPDNARAGRGSNPGGGASRPHGGIRAHQGGEAAQPPKPGPEGAGGVKIPPEKKRKKSEKILKKNKISVDTKYVLCYIHSHPLTTSGGHKVL